MAAPLILGRLCVSLSWLQALSFWAVSESGKHSVELCSPLRRDSPLPCLHPQPSPSPSPSQALPLTQLLVQGHTQSHTHTHIQMSSTLRGWDRRRHAGARCRPTGTLRQAGSGAPFLEKPQKSGTGGCCWVGIPWVTWVLMQRRPTWAQKQDPSVWALTGVPPDLGWNLPPIM